MKIHRTLIIAVAEALEKILREGRHADKVIEQLLKSNPKWGSRDRAFLAENIYEVVRWWRLLWAAGGRGTVDGGQWTGDRGRGTVDSGRWTGDGGGDDIKLFSLDDFVRLIGINLLVKQPEVAVLPSNMFPAFAGLEARTIAKNKSEAEKTRSIRHSIPDWMDDLGFAELGPEWDKELSALNQPAPMVIRCNTLKTNLHGLKSVLEKEGWHGQATDLAPNALVLNRRGNIFSVKAFQQGLFELQDAGSQCIAPFLQVEAGMRVVDACAGAGGKSLHLAALMENRGSIISLDVEAWKLEELRRRARRNGVSIIQPRPIESSKTVKRLYSTADRLLLDVPCSGLGTLRRNPDAKWKLSPGFLDSVRATQADILQQYSKILKPGGRLVYATCSLLPSENEQQVQEFLARNPAYELEEQQTISPLQHGFDGFFMARLKFNG